MNLQPEPEGTAPLVGESQERPWFEGLRVMQTITLNDAERDWFLALLDSDDEPNEAMKKAAELYRQDKRDRESHR